MIRRGEIAGLLAAAGIGAPVVIPGGLPRMPDEVIQLAQTGGAGESHERAFERPTLQVIVRGPQQNPEGAEDLADRVDRVLMDNPQLSLGVRHVLSVQWVGGPPAYLAEDDSRRTVMVCNYLVHVAR